MRSGAARRTIILPAILLLVEAIAGPEFCTCLRPARAQGGAESNATARSTPADARDDDRAAVKSTLDSFVKTFVSRDTKALAGYFTDEAEYQSIEGTRVRGREPIAKGFTNFFARTPEVAAELHSDGVRFLSTDSAIDEGTVTVRRGPLDPAATARYSALCVRDKGQWRLALLSESAIDKVSLEDLGWLAGQWKSTKNDGAEITTTYSWHPNKKFLQAEFIIKEKDRTFSGSQIIGIEPTSGEIHSWTFEADGGIGEANWHRDGDHWVLEASGATAFGEMQKETNILRRISDDKFTWQSVNRTIGDAEVADLAPVKVTRVKSGN
jgi:uncharacterized protein (TIGR02246 family)